MVTEAVKIKPIRVVVVDDSALIRQWMSEILAAEKDIEVVATAENAQDARQKIKTFNPDVVTLDIEMPGMNGLDFLEKIMSLRPMPVVIVSTLTVRGAPASLEALELGAVDVVAKPTGASAPGSVDFPQNLVTKVRVASRARVQSRAPSGAQATKKPVRSGLRPLGDHLIAIGSSTGGVEALTRILPDWPVDTPPVVITQHIPSAFAISMAGRLNTKCQVSVQIAENNMKLRSGSVYIAPGDRHLRVKKVGRELECVVAGEDLVSGHCPSVDVLFESVAKEVGSSAIGVIMTGMGKDGARGLLAMRQTGAQTIGQDEASCVVYGMPRAAAMAGAVGCEVPLTKITKTVFDLYKSAAA